jgi:hypothetical protein
MMRELSERKLGVIGPQQLARGQRQDELGVVLVDRDQLGQRAHVVFQRAVKRLARNALGHQPCQHQTHRPQQQQRRQHPVENFAKQRALFALEKLQG